MTLSKYNTAADVDYLVAEFPPIVDRLRKISPLYGYFLKTGQRKAAGPGTHYGEEEHSHDDTGQD